MKAYGIIGIGIIVGAIPLIEYRPDRDGAETLIGISVVDDSGNVVPDARVYFKFFKTFEKFYIVEKLTDKNGYVECAGFTRGEVVVRIEKDCYYYTTSHVKYQNLPWRDVITSRMWAKDPIVSKITLKRILAPQKKKLVDVAKECLEIGIQAAKPFGFVGDIGNAIEKHAKKNGFSIVRDLCGHGVGLEFHEEPDVEHFGKKGTGMLLVPGMTFTIEPMVNMGTHEVFVDEEDDWTVVTEDELPSAQWEHTFVMTEEGLEILTY